MLYRGNPVRSSKTPLDVLERCMKSVTEKIVTPLRRQQHDVRVTGLLKSDWRENQELINTIKKNAKAVGFYAMKRGGNNQRDNLYQALMSCRDMYKKYDAILVTRYDIEYKQPVDFDRWFNKNHDVTYMSWEPGRRRICDVMFIIKAESIDQFMYCVKRNGHPHMLHCLFQSFQQNGLSHGSILPRPTRVGTGHNKHPLFWIRREIHFKKK